MSFNQPDNADDFEPTQMYDDTLFDKESDKPVKSNMLFSEVHILLQNSKDGIK